MKKATLQFPSLEEMARFSKAVSSGFLMNTNKLTLTGAFSASELERAIKMHAATLVETTDQVYTY